MKQHEDQFDKRSTTFMTKIMIFNILNLHFNHFFHKKSVGEDTMQDLCEFHWKSMQARAKGVEHLLARMNSKKRNINGNG